MRTPKPKLLRPAAWVPSAVLALILPACDGSGSGYRSPTAPPVPIPPPSTGAATFTGQLTVGSVSGPGSCFSIRPGESVGGQFWGLNFTADSFTLDFELGNHWYSGRLEGRSFAGNYTPALDYAASPCGYTSSISGTFASDFSSFEARETLILGPPENQQRVELDWRASGSGLSG